MPKKKSKRKKLIEKLDMLLAQYIRLRDKNICQHCGKTSEDNRAMHVSHIIPRSRGHRYRWEVLNAIILCFHCHINWWHKNPVEAGDWFRKAFSERYKYLRHLLPSHLLPDAIKFTDLELEKKITGLEDLING